MKIILALGNPEKKYARTRHNVGFMLLDNYAARQGANWREQTKFHADTADFILNDEKIILAKPTTYYNETGVAARSLLDFYKLSLKDLLVIHDDAVLDFGKVRVRQGGRDAGNNGLKSLHQNVGVDFWHIRVGTDSLLRRQIGDFDFVLGAFNQDELKILQDWTAPTVDNIIEQFLTGQIEATSYRLQ